MLRRAGDGQFGRVDAAALHSFDVEPQSFNRWQSGLDGVQRGAGVDERGQKHVSGYSANAVQVKGVRHRP
jgi:hypothetical protein